METVLEDTLAKDETVRMILGTNLEVRLADRIATPFFQVIIQGLTRRRLVHFLKFLLKKNLQILQKETTRLLIRRKEDVKWQQGFSGEISGGHHLERTRGIRRMGASCRNDIMETVRYLSIGQQKVIPIFTIKNVGEMEMAFHSTTFDLADIVIGIQ